MNSEIIPQLKAQYKVPGGVIEVEVLDVQIRHDRPYAHVRAETPAFDEYYAFAGWGSCNEKWVRFEFLQFDKPMTFNDAVLWFEAYDWHMQMRDEVPL